MLPLKNKHHLHLSESEASNKELIITIKKENEETRATISNENGETSQKISEEF